MFGSLAPRRRLLVAGVLLLCAVFAAIVLFPRTENPPRPLSEGPAPVILVHGYGGDSTAMAAIAARLQRDGLAVTSVDLPQGGTGDITESARTVAEAVEATGAAAVDLVGFSAGGVVIRAYLEEGGTGRARYVVTLGSPHHGTSIARAAALGGPGACVDACEQLVPGSSFLEELNEPDETPPGPRFVAVWTAFDETVTPPESATLDGAINVKVQDVCSASTIGHGDLPRDPMVLGLIVKTLAGKVDDPPQPAQCARLQTLGT